MDPETSRAIESLRQDFGQRITAVETVLRAEMRGLRDELREELHGETGTLRGEIQEVRGEIQEVRGEIQEVRGEIQEVRGEIIEVRGEMREMREELMRHAMVLTDSVRDDIRIVADGLAAVSAKLDALRR